MKNGFLDRLDRLLQEKIGPLAVQSDLDGNAAAGKRKLSTRSIQNGKGDNLQRNVASLIIKILIISNRTKGCVNMRARIEDKATTADQNITRLFHNGRGRVRFYSASAIKANAFNDTGSTFLSRTNDRCAGKIDDMVTRSRNNDCRTSSARLTQAASGSWFVQIMTKRLLINVTAVYTRLRCGAVSRFAIVNVVARSRAQLQIAVKADLCNTTGCGIAGRMTLCFSDDITADRTLLISRTSCRKTGLVTRGGSNLLTANIARNPLLTSRGV